RVDHDQASPRVAGQLAQYHSRAREALRLPRVLADEHRHLGVLVLAARVPAVQLRVDERLTGLLLRQRARPVASTQRAHERAAVGAAKVISLASAAVIEDPLATELVADRGKAPGHRRDSLLPTDLLERSVRAAPQRGLQPVATILVMVQAHRLVAGVALRRRVGLVAADPCQAPAIELHLDPAVALAEDARGLLPAAGGHLVHHGHQQAPSSKTGRPGGRSQPTMTCVIIKTCPPRPGN